VRWGSLSIISVLAGMVYSNPPPKSFDRGGNGKVW